MIELKQQVFPEDDGMEIITNHVYKRNLSGDERGDEGTELTSSIN